MPRSTRLSILLAILLVALAVRLVGLQFGLPFAYARPDETEAAGPAVTYLTSGSLRPQFFQWPSLFSYIVAALYALYGGVLGFVTGHASLAAFVESRYQWFAPFLLIPRAFSMAMGVLTVGAVYALGRRVFDEAIALVGALFPALCFLHVRDSHFGMSDVTMTLFVVLAVLAAVLWQQKGGVPRALLAGLLVGLAGSTKYNGLAVGVAFVFAAVTQLFPAHVTERATTQHSTTERAPAERPTTERARSAVSPSSALTATAAFGIAVALGFFGGSPYILLEWSRFLTDIGTVQETMATGHGGMQISRGWWYFGSVILPAALGWPLYVASLVGIVGLGAEAVTRQRRHVAVFLAFPLAYYLYAGQSYSVFARYIEPVIPFLCLAAAWAVATGVRLVARSEAHAPASRSQSIALAVTALLCIAPSAWSTIQLDRLLSRTDNRVIVAHALADVLPASELIYQSGSSYGRVPLGIDGRGAELPEATFDADSGAFAPAEPAWILVQRSPLVMYSRVPETLERVLRERYRLVTAFPTDATADNVDRLYDQQDAFYLPLAGFSGLRRPGPAFELYQRR